MKDLSMVASSRPGVQLMLAHQGANLVVAEPEEGRCVILSLS